MAGKEEKRLIRVIVIFFIGLILYFSSSALGRKNETGNNELQSKDMKTIEGKLDEYYN